jgi:acetyltransferase-like isoleucine patch superfamily enzyme
MKLQERLNVVAQVLQNGVDKQGAIQILSVMGAEAFPMELLDELKLYSDYLPKIQEFPYTEEQRFLHFLWDTLDKLPISAVVDFAIPFRRMIGKRLFKKCGKNFIAEENVRFNFGQNIEIYDDVFINRGVYIDSKGGVILGNYVGIAEYVNIFTHGHSESTHSERTYQAVKVEDFAKIYSHATLLPGVVVGRQGIVASKALVSANVAPNTLVAGVPAKAIRERKTNGKTNEALNHIWLFDSAFQDE